jgi:hypothetical protein
MPSVPGVLNYPAALDDAISLIEVANNGSSTLTANISVSDLLIPVARPAKFSNSGIVTLTDSLTAPTKIEIVLYTSKSASNLVVPVGGRGAQGTTAQAFSTGHLVEQRPTARHHTALADLLLLLEAKLGIGGSAPGGSGQALVSDVAGASAWRAIAQADISGLAAALADKVSKSDAALQTIISNPSLSKDSPVISLTDTVGTGGTGIINVNENFMYMGRIGQFDMLLSLLNGVITLGLTKPRREQGESAEDYNRRVRERGELFKTTLGERREDETMRGATTDARRSVYERSLNAKQMERAGKLSSGSVRMERQIEALRGDVFASLRSMPEYRTLSAKDQKAVRELVNGEASVSQLAEASPPIN